MNRVGAVFWLVLVVAAGFTTFKVKYAVQDVEDQLNRARKQTIAEQQEIRVLTAEWTYLNQPERLAELNRRFLALAPVAARQLQPSAGDIPLRPPPVPDVVLAANPDPAPTLSAAPSAPAALPIAPAVLDLAAARPAPPVQLAIAGSSAHPNSLDALIAQIAGAH